MSLSLSRILQRPSIQQSITSATSAAQTENQLRALRNTPMLASQSTMRSHLFEGKYETGSYVATGTVGAMARRVVRDYYTNKYGETIPDLHQENGYNSTVYASQFASAKAKALIANGLSTDSFLLNIQDSAYAGVIAAYMHGTSNMIDTYITDPAENQAMKNRCLFGAEYQDGWSEYVTSLGGGNINTDMTGKSVYFMRWGHPSGVHAYQDAVTYEEFASSVIYYDSDAVAGSPVAGELATGPVVHVMTAVWPGNATDFPAYGITAEMSGFGAEMPVVNAAVAADPDNVSIFLWSWGISSWGYFLGLMEANGHLARTHVNHWCSVYKTGVTLITPAEFDLTSTFCTEVNDTNSELYDIRFAALQHNHIAAMLTVDFIAQAELYLKVRNASTGEATQAAIVAKLAEDIEIPAEFGSLSTTLSGLPKKHASLKFITVTPAMESTGFAFVAPGTVAGRVGAVQDNIEQLQGSGPNPAGFVQELFGVFPLSLIPSDVIRETGASTETIVVNGQTFRFPKDTQRMFKGHHDTLRIPLTRSTPADIAAAMSEDPASYTQCAFDSMQVVCRSGRTPSALRKSSRCTCARTRSPTGSAIYTMVATRTRLPRRSSATGSTSPTTASTLRPLTTRRTAPRHRL